MSEREIIAIANCELLLDRLKLVVLEETDALNAGGGSFHGQFTGRKNQLLRDLLIAQRACGGSQAAALAPKTRSLQKLLARNQRLLKAHIDAVREVSAIIVDAIRQAESDGTYSRPSKSEAPAC